MPTFRPLSADQLAALQRRRGAAVDLTEYSDFIRNLQVGEGGHLTLESNEQKRTVKHRLTRAAHLLGRSVRYRRSEGNTIRFELVTSSAI